MAKKLSQTVGEEVDADEAFATYGEDEDGVLSEDEAKTFWFRDVQFLGCPGLA